MEPKTVISICIATLSVFKESPVTSRLENLSCQLTVQAPEKTLTEITKTENKCENRPAQLKHQSDRSTQGNDLLLFSHVF
jgi:hypothetical protein